MKKAFPVSIPEDKTPWDSGMSYREWLVGQLLAGKSRTEPLRGGDAAMLARNAIEIADATITRLFLDPEKS